jgi:polyisoprenyl-phosphate glycosyltransferase
MQRVEGGRDPGREQAPPSLHGVSVVLPVYRNAPVLPELCRRLRAALHARVLEIVMVDDCSPDDSLAVMRSLDVVAVPLLRRTGQNGAILTGLARATQPLTCVLDADLQDPPEALPRMLARLSEGDVSVVFSTRETASPPSSRLFRWVIHRMFPNLPLRPCLCFAMDAPTRRALLGLATERDYLVAALGALAVRTAVVSVQREARPTGRSAYGTLRRTRYAARALFSAFRLRLHRRGKPA